MLEQNNCTISGKIITAPELSHKFKDEKFYLFKVESERKSGVNDIIPALISERFIKDIEIDKYITIQCQIRTHNRKINDVNRLLIFAFVNNYDILTQEQYEEIKDNDNEINLTGFICKNPNYRTTPFGREITDILLAVNRNNNRSDYIPCITWGRNAIYASKLSVGTCIQIKGRFQSREYDKKLADGTVEQRVAYEISVTSINEVENNKEEKEDQE